MCGPKVCSMNISAKVEALTPQEAASIADGELAQISGDD
jgi:hypothetical protein